MKKHVNPQFKNRTAVAPYNFVPLPDKVMTVPDPPDQDKFIEFSGHFDCELETSTPLFIRGMPTEADILAQKETRLDPQHFSLDGGATPAIPGSSLRGLFHSLVEIISHAHPFAITNQKQVYRSVDTTSHGEKYRNRLMREDPDDPNRFTYRAVGGYIRVHDNAYYIQPAKRHQGVTFARIEKSIITSDLPTLADWYNDGKPGKPKDKIFREVYVKADLPAFHQTRNVEIFYSKVNSARQTTGVGYQRGFMIKSGHMDKKRQEAVIFEPDPQKSSPQDWILIDEDQQNQYKDTLSQWQQQHIGDSGVLQEGHPVFYLLEDEKLVFFGHTLLLRLPYQHAPWDMIPEEIKNEPGLDMAQALFGTAGDEQSVPARAGRVFFTDAHAAAGQVDYFEDIIRPHLLLSPKPTAFQHYLVQEKPDDKNALMDYDSKTILRGYKLYWHKGKIKVEEITETDRNRLDRERRVETRIKPVKTDKKFAFKLTFQNLTIQELGALTWLLQVGANPQYRFKLGMGKPLGMGAVQITKAEPVFIKREKRYTALFKDDHWEEGIAETVNVDGVEKPVSAVPSLAVEAFTQWLLADRTINPGDCNNLEDLPRIQMLLRMLDWQNPLDAGLTRYMEIQRYNPDTRRKENEYKERPVLPTPLAADKVPKGDRAPQPQRVSSQEPSLPRRSKPRQGPAMVPRIEIPEERDEVSESARKFADLLASQSGRAEPVEGSLVDVKTIDDQDDEHVYFEILGLDPDAYYGQMAVADLPDDWQEGKALKCQVISTYIDEGLTFLVIKPVKG